MCAYRYYDSLLNWWSEEHVGVLAVGDDLVDIGVDIVVDGIGVEVVVVGIAV